VDLSLCYAAVQPGISKEDAPSGGRGEATNPEQGATTFGRQGDPVRRRELVLLLGGVMMTAPAVRAQQKAMPVIGILGSGAERLHRLWPPSSRDLAKPAMSRAKT
jgi:hypothetical protein